MFPFVLLLFVAVTDAGSPSQRVVNGVEAVPHSYPSQLSLQRYQSHICGAVLVNNNYAITAAHCVYGGSASNYRIKCGAHNIGVAENSQQTVAIASMRVHPQYNIYGGSPAFANDIAVLKLATPVQYTKECTAANLPRDNSDYANMQAMITGWGRVHGNGPLPSRLMEGSVDVLSPQTCYRQYWGGTVDDRFHICVKDLGDKIFGGCNGDSGGPVHVENTVVGLASFVAGACMTSYPTVYVRLSHYMQWISDTMQSLG